MLAKYFLAAEIIICADELNPSLEVWHGEAGTMGCPWGAVAAISQAIYPDMVPVHDTLK